jgi:hypothetical protein
MLHNLHVLHVRSAVTVYNCTCTALGTLPGAHTVDATVCTSPCTERRAVAAEGRGFPILSLNVRVTVATAPTAGLASAKLKSEAAAAVAAGDTQMVSGLLTAVTAPELLLTVNVWFPTCRGPTGHRNYSHLHCW